MKRKEGLEYEIGARMISPLGGETERLNPQEATNPPGQKTEKNNALSKVTAQGSNCDNKVSRTLVLLHLARHSTGPLPHNSRPALVLLHLTRGSRTGQSSKTDPLPRHESGGVLPEQHFIRAQIYLFLLTNISINYRIVCSHKNNDHLFQTTAFTRRDIVVSMVPA